MNAQLILENGKRFSGKMFGAVKNVVGEVVFTTEMIGYQDILGDPSYAGQIVAMTFPVVGNYGINFEDMEAERVNLTAFIVREKCDYPSNFRNEMTIDDFLKQQGVVGLEGIDTRALTRTLRDSGCMRGVIAMGYPSDSEVKMLFDSYDDSTLICKTAAKEKYVLNQNAGKRLAFIDLGTRASFLKEFVDRSYRVTVFPQETDADEILSEDCGLVYVADGPGNPLAATHVVETVKKLIGRVPVCGIGLGHQIIGLALGGKVEKLKFGHHGANQPVKNLKTGKVHTTSQNHNYIITDLPDDVETTFINVNDKTCEGFVHKTLPVAGVQFNPELLSGGLNIDELFGTIMRGGK